METCRLAACHIRVRTWPTARITRRHGFSACSCFLQCVVGKKSFCYSFIRVIAKARTLRLLFSKCKCFFRNYENKWSASDFLQSDRRLNRVFPISETGSRYCMCHRLVPGTCPMLKTLKNIREKTNSTYSWKKYCVISCLPGSSSHNG